METLTILSRLWDPNHDKVVCSDLSGNINTAHRSSVLKWLFESLDLLRIEDRVFFATVMLADRYCALVAPRRKFEGSELQLIILSALCCSLKVVESSLDLSVKAFLEHVSGGHVEPKDIFATESKILQALDFNTFTPSLSVYLESFYFVLMNPVKSVGPLEQDAGISTLPSWASKQYYLSLYLLYLVVFEVDLLHSRKPCEVVSACILASAITCFDDRRDIDKLVDALFQAGWISETCDISELVSEISTLWMRATNQKSEIVQSIVHLFDTKEKHFVSRLYPKHSYSVHVSGG